jgi:hypothetical protein
MNTEKRRILKVMIGRVERINVIDAGIERVPAKIDTGAFRSSIWATNIYEIDEQLHFTLLGPESPWYTGKELSVDKYEIVEVENSFGHKENRYSVHIKIKMGPKIVNSNFTLSDRSQKIYPVLIGRKLLRGKFVVDVSEGEPLEDEESAES